MRVNNKPALAVASVLLIMATFVPEVWSGGSVWAIRGASICLWAGTTWTLARCRHGRPLLVGPIYLLPTIAVFFYSFVPAVYLAVFVKILQIEPVNPTVGIALQAIDGQGELWIIRFAVLGLMCAIFTGTRFSPSPRPVPFVERWIQIGGIVAAMGYIASHIVIRGPLATEVAFASLALFTYALAWQGLAAAERRLAVGVRLFVLVALCIPVMYAGGTKSVAIIGAACLLLLIISPNTSRRLRLLLISGLVVAPAILALGLHVLRDPNAIPRLFTMANIKQQITHKVIFRQTETVFCLNNAISDVSVEKETLYFGRAVVPRLLWPEKPTLSVGTVFALRYCGYKASDISPIRPHSSSVTLLGEPYINGGAKGETAAVLVLCLGLGALTRLWNHGHPALAAAVLGLSQWTLDFDQHFAMALANFVKSALVVIPLALVLRGIARHQSAGGK